MTTIADRLAAPRHGFDWLRLLFAGGVLLWHSALLSSFTRPAMFDQQWAVGLASLCVPGFFAASGFLVAASAERNDIQTFYTYRLARVIPGLTAVVLLSAVVLGPMITTLPLKAYFAHPLVSLYGLNAVGIADSPYLPGVFQGRFFQEVNGSLWTIGLELACYFWLGVAALGGVLRRPRLVAAAGVVAVIALPVLAVWDHSLVHSARPALMFGCFTLGAALYVWRDRISYSLPLGLASALLAATLNMANHVDLSLLPWTYAVVVLGLTDMPKMKADLSYGIYLASSPVLQVVATFSIGQVWWGNLMWSIPITLAYATLSRWLLEGPILARKRGIANSLDRLFGRYRQGGRAPLGGEAYLSGKADVG